MSEELSEYERIRLRNIEERRKMMEELQGEWKRLKDQGKVAKRTFKRTERVTKRH